MRKCDWKYRFIGQQWQTRMFSRRPKYNDATLVLSSFDSKSLTFFSFRKSRQKYWEWRHQDYSCLATNVTLLRRQNADKTLDRRRRRRRHHRRRGRVAVRRRFCRLCWGLWSRQLAWPYLTAVSWLQLDLWPTSFCLKRACSPMKFNIRFLIQWLVMPSNGW